MQQSSWFWWVVLYLRVSDASRWGAGAAPCPARPLTVSCPRAERSSQVSPEAIGETGICAGTRPHPPNACRGVLGEGPLYRLFFFSGVPFHVQITRGEENTLQKWVPLYSLFPSVKLYQRKSCRRQKQDSLWLCLIFTWEELYTISSKNTISDFDGGNLPWADDVS